MLATPDNFLVFHVPVLRDIFSKGSLVCKLQWELQAELWMAGNAGSWRKEWTGANSLHNKEHRDLWHQPGYWALRDTAENDDPAGIPQIIAHLDCEGIKAQ